MVNLFRMHKKINSIVGKADCLADTNGSINSNADIVVPLVSNLFNISCEVIEILQSYLQRSGSRDARELMFLLQRPTFQVLSCQLHLWSNLWTTLFAFQSLLLVHDTISQKDYTPKLPELPFDIVDEEEETVKIVQLVKSNEPLVTRNLLSVLLSILTKSFCFQSLAVMLLGRLKPPSRLW